MTSKDKTPSSKEPDVALTLGRPASMSKEDVHTFAEEMFAWLQKSHEKSRGTTPPKNKGKDDETI